MVNDRLLRLKIFGGILLSLFILALARTITSKIYHDEALPKLAYPVRQGIQEKKSAPMEEEKPIGDLSVLLKEADATEGKRIAAKCRTCHSFEKNGKIKIGPPLWGIIDSPAGAYFGFSYSKGLKQKNIHWSPHNMNLFVQDPQDYIPGTKMKFAGIRDAIDRANLIAYLQTLNSLSSGTR
ncbi:MAG: cytochrome c family protein [Alphaproteobacteria bacterium GM7ARS4]|nr:cytochrome c family protein [Alphaproteobacteria bacterium GM7ARS4]